MSMNINKKIQFLVNQFDLQIKMEYKSANGKKENCPSYWHKNLFLKSLNLNTNDWKIIRSGDYWDIRDLLRDIDQIKFTYDRVLSYLGESNTTDHQ
jgi:hypothetical protein